MRTSTSRGIISKGTCAVRTKAWLGTRGEGIAASLRCYRSIRDDDNDGRMGGGKEKRNDGGGSPPLGRTGGETTDGIPFLGSAIRGRNQLHPATLPTNIPGEGGMNDGC